ncbi:hypothetical protein [Streptomyces sp. NPDC049879]|uniref:hypothetical protein n=1 Tax=Streptomyces sp. NPDC049879 TaxID=3365598 RepID=UPI0037A8D552
MTTPYRFRHISGPWGLRVDLTATSSEAAAADGGAAGEAVAPGVRLDVRDPDATAEDREQLAHGLRYAAPHIREAVGGRAVTVTVERIAYPLTDYQPEAAALALTGWAAGHFGFPPLPATVTFRGPSEGYAVRLGGCGDG